MDIIEKRANKKRLHGVKFKFDTNNLGIRDCSTEDMKKYLTSMINEMFSKAGLYYNKIYFKPDNNSIFIQVLRNDFKRKSTRLNSSHLKLSRMPSSA